MDRNLSEGLMMRPPPQQEAALEELPVVEILERAQAPKPVPAQSLPEAHREILVTLIAEGKKTQADAYLCLPESRRDQYLALSAEARQDIADVALGLPAGTLAHEAQDPALESTLRLTRKEPSTFLNFSPEERKAVASMQGQERRMVMQLPQEERDLYIELTLERLKEPRPAPAAEPLKTEECIEEPAPVPAAAGGAAAITTAEVQAQHEPEFPSQYSLVYGALLPRTRPYWS